MRKSYSLSEFGTSSIGSSGRPDITAALQAAIDAGPEILIELPQGDMELSGITLAKHVHIKGAGMGISNIYAIDPNQHTIKLDASAQTDSVILPQLSDFSLIGLDDAIDNGNNVYDLVNWSMADVIDSAEFISDELDNLVYPFGGIQNVLLVNSQRYGLCIQGASEALFQHIVCSNSYNTGIHIEDGSGQILNFCQSLKSGGHGFDIAGKHIIMQGNTSKKSGWNMDHTVAAVGSIRAVSKGVGLKMSLDAVTGNCINGHVSIESANEGYELIGSGNQYIGLVAQYPFTNLGKTELNSYAQQTEGSGFYIKAGTHNEDNYVTGNVLNPGNKFPTTLPIGVRVDAGIGEYAGNINVGSSNITQDCVVSGS